MVERIYEEDALAKGLAAAGRNPDADATERRGGGISSTSLNPCRETRYVLDAGWSNFSACCPAPVQHIIAFDTLEGFFGTPKGGFFSGMDWTDSTFEEFKSCLDSYIEWYRLAKLKRALWVEDAQGAQEGP